MKESIGKTIRRLRKERGLTQEELAERLNITSQAVSKWESESGMPDISQIVPLSSVFGVSTDVLFGLDTTTEASEAWEIVGKARAMERYGQRETYLAAYDELCRGLKKYPSNLVLLNVCMSLGTSLSLPDNGWIYDPERGEQIAGETVRMAERITACSENMTEILTARQNLVFLHLARGEYEQAAAQARGLPARNGFTACSFLADVHSATGHYDSAVTCLCSDLALTLQVLEDDIARLGKAYHQNGQYTEAIKVYETFFAMLKAIFGDDCPPPYHDFDSGDLYLLLAAAHLERGDGEKAMGSLEESIHYWFRLLKEGSPTEGKISWRSLMRTPLLEHTADFAFVQTSILREKLTRKLQTPELAPLREHPRYQKLVKLVNNLPL